MKHRRSGFTLTEMLVTIGILAVLLAVAIPAIITVRGNLKMRELDDTAREIFLAAQNSLTARKAASVKLEMGANGSDPFGSTEVHWLSSSPSGTEEGTGALLSAGAIEGVAAGNHYMICYDATTATVMQVYYSESSLSALEGQIKGFGYSGAEHKEERREKKIGYYDGEDIEGREVEPLVPPMVTIENGDELTVTVTVFNAPEYAAGGVKLTVTVEALDGSGRRSFDSCPYDGGTGEYSLTLDSLKTGKHFKDICGDIAPGADIRVTATLSREADPSTGTAYLPASAYADTNSLFAGRAEGTVYIAKPRHLQNLEPTVSGVNKVPGDYYAEQTASIDWATAPVELFQPIENGSLRGYDGQGNAIANLEIECGSTTYKGVGLFGYAVDATLERIRLVDPAVTKGNVGTNTAEYAGALAGYLNRSAVSDCQVYDTAGRAEVNFEGQNVGGLIGRAQDSTIKNSSASLPKIADSESSASIGGLIGYAYGGVTIEQCYADTGWMDDSTKKWHPAYGLIGGSSVTGTANIGSLIGSAGDGSVKDCYALGWFSWEQSGTEEVSGDAKLVGSGSAAVSNSYSILQSAGGNRYYTYTTDDGGKEIGSLSELSTFTWSTGESALGGTTPYHRNICDGNYPYPRLSAHHYGDWPSQSVDGIKLFDGNSTDSKELKFFMAPVDPVGLAEGEVRTVTFYAEAQNAGKAAMQAVTAECDHTDIIPEQNEIKYDDKTGRTKIVLKVEAEKDPLVTYVDLKADEYTLRAVVIPYRATVKLTGKNEKTGTDAWITSTACSNGKSDTKTLPLHTGSLAGTNTGTFTAKMVVQPSYEDIRRQVADWNEEAVNGGAFTLSLPTNATELGKLFADWEAIYKDDPEVTANGSPDEGANILAPVKDNDGKVITYYPNAKTDGDGKDDQLTVFGEASGTAEVSARWAKDPKLEATCKVKMNGARALIKAASAKGNGGRDLGEKGNYPYRLDLTAEPGEAVKLTFTPKLFKTGIVHDTFTWKIDGGDVGNNGDNVTYANVPNEGEWTYVLPANISGTHTVTLIFRNEDTGERSVDFMTFSVYRQARAHDGQYEAIVVQNRKTGKQISDNNAGQVEQLKVEQGEYAGVEKIELESYVKGAANPRVKWYAKLEPGDKWEEVTGVVGSQTVVDGTGKARAKVEWLRKTEEDPTDYDHMSAGDGKGKATGGAIRVTGLDVNEYDNEFSVELKAEALEYSGEGSAPYKEVTVTVMPKLEIIPKAKSAVSLIIGKSYKFKVNRQDAAYDYVWTRNGETVSSGKGSPEQQIDGEQGQSVLVTCTYGPFTERATFTWQSSLDKMASSINSDYFIPAADAADNTEYFIIERGKTRELDFTWGCALRYNIRNEDTTLNSAKYIQFIGQPGGSTQSKWEGYYIGERTYQVKGEEFTGGIEGTKADKSDYGVETLKWNVGYWDFPKYFAVVGMEIDRSSITNNTLVLRKNQTFALKAVTSFADVLVKEGTSPKVTWESDHPDLVSVDRNTGMIKAVKNGTATYAATITATYEVQCKDGRTYIFHDYINVKVQPEGTMNVDLQPCTTDPASNDVEMLSRAFPDAGLSANSVLVPVERTTEGDKWALIQAPTFGLDTLYLKATATVTKSVGTGTSTTPLTSLDDYVCRVLSDAAYLDIDYKPVGGTLYIKVKAKTANAGLKKLPLSVEIGIGTSDEKEIYLYDKPRVELTRLNVSDQDKNATNGSLPVFLNDTPDVSLTAKLVPTLYSIDDRSTPLDTVAWKMRAATGYEPEQYLVQTDIDGGIRVTQKGTEKPDFRVVLRAYSAASAKTGEPKDLVDAGYALVFLPEEK